MVFRTHAINDGIDNIYWQIWIFFMYFFKSMLYLSKWKICPLSESPEANLSSYKPVFPPPNLYLSSHRYRTPLRPPITVGSVDSTPPCGDTRRCGRDIVRASDNGGMTPTNLGVETRSCKKRDWQYSSHRYRRLLQIPILCNHPTVIGVPRGLR